MSDLERQLEELFMSDSRSRRVDQVNVVPAPQEAGGRRRSSVPTGLGLGSACGKEWRTESDSFPYAGWLGLLL